MNYYVGLKNGTPYKIIISEEKIFIDGEVGANVPSIPMNIEESLQDGTLEQINENEYIIKGVE